jgi:hypothetical protein
MLRGIKMKNSTSVMGDDEEAVEHTKRQRRHGEKIHCGDGLAMVAQEGLP